MMLTCCLMDHVHLKREVLTIDGMLTWGVQVELFQGKAVKLLVKSPNQDSR